MTHGTESETIGTDENAKNMCSERNWNIRMLNIIFVSVGFLVIFVAFNTTENFMTSLYGNYGMISLCSIYLSFAVCGLFVPLIIRRIGEKWTLVIGGICIVPFLTMNIFANVYLLIVMSLFVGFGQSVLWCAQGSLLTRCSKPEKRGRNSGIFFFIYQLNQSVGNGFAYVMTLTGLQLVYLFIIFTCLCVIGIVPFIFIQMGVLPDIERVSIKTDLRNLWKVFKSPAMLLLFPLFIYSGITQCYIYGEVTAMFGVEWVSIAMCVFGTVNMVVSLIFGRISDTIGRIPTLIIASLVMFMGLFSIVLHFFLGSL
ncbi:hypothetical protein EIN_055860 [Entamoeba invadens IP1]|uniref:hypothetical protein n=1 Tax=Entamoeba invadens IP1 TaxID=370355 RepID=UPI0002C3DC6F|nr:hypothetical protein EIN_055860 [Entamoeba invadens IP1]ELP93231.1 hypothetical protein EIN_055860 [Entamoeba invadens IP1]|eukprot:XP_004260002.1 hypothetical protein EIN_055860 [Entamoeba invadens IP1]